MAEVAALIVFVAVAVLVSTLPDRVLKCPPDCDLGPGWHVHFPEGRTCMTPAQWDAARESIRKARREVRDAR